MVDESEYRLDFGKYKGRTLKDTPDTWLLWCYTNVKRTPDKEELFEYLDDNIEAIRVNVSRMALHNPISREAF